MEGSKLMHVDRIRTTIEEAVFVSVRNMKLPGIVHAEVEGVALSSEHLQQMATQIEQHSDGEVVLSAQIERTRPAKPSSR